MRKIANTPTGIVSSSAVSVAHVSKAVKVQQKPSNFANKTACKDSCNAVTCFCCCLFTHHYPMYTYVNADKCTLHCYVQL
jgi:hypothetical protein